jgi:hypothetical protein
MLILQLLADGMERNEFNVVELLQSFLHNDDDDDDDDDAVMCCL